jgi:hypothetical protein
MILSIQYHLFSTIKDPDKRCIGPHNERFTINSTTTGAFLKKCCHKHIAANLAEAREGCRAEDMELLQIENDEVQDALFDFYQKNYNRTTLIARTDGTLGTDGNWYYQSYDKSPVFANLKWNTRSNIQTGDNSITISNVVNRDSDKKSSSFGFDAYPLLNRLSGYICQYEPIADLAKSNKNFYQSRLRKINYDLKIFRRR